MNCFSREQVEMSSKTANICKKTSLTIITPDKGGGGGGGDWVNIFSYFSTKTYVVGTH